MTSALRIVSVGKEILSREARSSGSMSGLEADAAIVAKAKSSCSVRI
jgi:hypothetical protein